MNHQFSGQAFKRYKFPDGNRCSGDDSQSDQEECSTTCTSEYYDDNAAESMRLVGQLPEAQQTIFRQDEKTGLAVATDRAELLRILNRGILGPTAGKNPVRDFRWLLKLLEARGKFKALGFVEDKHMEDLMKANSGTLIGHIYNLAKHFLCTQVSCTLRTRSPPHTRPHTLIFASTTD